MKYSEYVLQNFSRTFTLICLFCFVLFKRQDESPFQKEGLESLNTPRLGKFVFMIMCFFNSKIDLSGGTLGIPEIRRPEFVVSCLC